MSYKTITKMEIWKDVWLNTENKIKNKIFNEADKCIRFGITSQVWKGVRVLPHNGLERSIRERVKIEVGK